MIKNVDLGHPSVAIEWGLMGFAVAIAGLAAYLAYDFYIVHRDRPNQVAKALGPIHRVVENKYFVDEAYFAGIIIPLISGSKALWVYVDVNFIDKITYWLTDLVQGLAQLLKTLQNGKTQQYALYMTLGFVVVITYALMGS